MNTNATRGGSKLLRFLLHLLIIAFFMNFADHILRANLDSFYRSVSIAVNLGGAMAGLAVIWLLRLLGLRWL